MGHNDCKDDDGGDLISYLWYPLCQKMALQSWEGWCIRGTVISHSEACCPLTSLVITGSQPRGEGGVDHCPCSWSAVHLWLEIRADSQKIRGWGWGGGGGDSEEDQSQRGREKWLRVKWPFPCHYKQQGWQSTSWVSISTHSTSAL